jgi:predicted TIM-barrel fold metal-dependent hydrolase
MKINIYTHFLPSKYKETLFALAPSGLEVTHYGSIPPLVDLDYRFRLMDKFDGLMEVLTLSGPPLHEILDKTKAADLVRLANDGLAELVLKHPDRFTAGVASLPLNDMDRTLEEADRAIRDLKLKGVQVCTPVNDKPLDSPEFLPLFEKMSLYDLPIWIHPTRFKTYPDYRTETTSKYMLCNQFGWPFETTLAMARIVYSGILERYPNLKLITHHCGGMVPYFRERITGSSKRMKASGDPLALNPSKPNIEYFKMFYYDTAINGNTPALMCAYDLCGADHLVFGTDMPFGLDHGETSLGEVIAAIEKMDISDLEKRKIYEDNARRLLHL